MNPIKIFAGLCVLFAIFTTLQNQSLKTDIKTLQDDKTTLLAEAMLKRMEVTGLINAVADQNKKITDFENSTKQMARARQEAQQEAAGRIQQLTSRITWLEQDKGASCNAAGIGKTIIDEVLP